MTQFLWSVVKNLAYKSVSFCISIVTIEYIIPINTITKNTPNQTYI